MLLKMLAATVAAMGLGIVLIAYDASDKAVIACTFAGAILLNLVLGVFDMPERKERTMHKTLSQGYREAACPPYPRP